MMHTNDHYLREIRPEGLGKMKRFKMTIKETRGEKKEEVVKDGEPVEKLNVEVTVKMAKVPRVEV